VSEPTSVCTYPQRLHRKDPAPTKVPEVSESIALLRPFSTALQGGVVASEESRGDHNNPVNSGP
jgi:hypothetical protein